MTADSKVLSVTSMVTSDGSHRPRRPRAARYEGVPDFDVTRGGVTLAGSDAGDGPAGRARCTASPRPGATW